MMKDILSKASQAVSYINTRIDCKPKIAIILGSGLGSLADEVHENRVEIPYYEIPNFPASKVEGHGNKLIVGKIYENDVIIMQGRFHYYEGYDMDEVTFPIRVFALLGVETLIVSNAAGGINKKFKPQDLMIINDHINICGVSPLRGENEEAFGTRFPSMTNAYSKRLIELTKDVASLKAFDDVFDKKTMRLAKDGEDLTIDVVEGVYAFMPGPQYETKAEIKMLDTLGADAVGMSTVPEVIVAAHSGIEVLGISCITNVTGTSMAPSHEEVLENAAGVETKFKDLIMRVLMKISK